MIKSSSAAPFGEIAITSVETADVKRPRDGSSSTPQRVHKYVWHPPARVRCNLPQDFQLAMWCYVGTDGLRRFAPASSVDEFIAIAATAGLAILIDRFGLEPEMRRCYRFMLFAFQLGRRMREHLERRFESTQDLRVTRSARCADGSPCVLPPYLGTNANGEESAWSVSRLIAKGQEAARRNGQANCADRIAIKYGLVEAARLQPLLVAETDLPILVRSALFDLAASKKLDPQVMQWTQRRLWKLFDAHLDDVSEQFDRWFFPGKGNLVKAIADQRSAAGGKLEIADVRSAVLQLAWKSYSYVGGCVHAWSRFFSKALPAPLAPDEQRIFDGAYLTQKHFANLPLVLLHERVGLLSPVVAELIEQPDDGRLIATLHCLLRIYGDMALARRTADRQSKRIDAYGQKTPLEVTGFELTEMPDLADVVGVSSALDPIAPSVARSHKLTCKSCDGWTACLLSDPEHDTEEIELDLRCSCGRRCEQVGLTREEFRDLASPLLELLRPNGLTSSAG